MSGLTGLWDQLVDAVCRPPRDSDYSDRDLVGARKAAFRIGKDRYYRQDLQLENVRGEKLACSHYRPCIVPSRDGRLPAVIYCHCNSGSRRDAEEILFYFLPMHVTVFGLDFSGSGKSEGSWVTLGAREVDDIEAAVRYLRDEGAALTIGLWGRSMGSVAAMLYARRDPSIAGLVLDSPFSRLRDLMLELGTSDLSLGIPKALTRVALAVLKRSVRRRAGFSVDDVSPIDAVGEIYCPVLLGHGTEDTFVPVSHSRRLVSAFAGEARLVTFDADHNSPRPDSFYEEAVAFMLRALRVDQLLADSDAFWTDVAAESPDHGRGGAEATSPHRATNPPWSADRLALARRSLDVGAGAWTTGWAVERSCPADCEPDARNWADEDVALARALEQSILDRKARIERPSRPPASSASSEEGASDEEARQLAAALELSLRTAEQEQRERESTAERATSPDGGGALPPRVAAPVPVVFELEDGESTPPPPPTPPAARGEHVAMQKNAMRHAADERNAVQRLSQDHGGSVNGG